MRTDTKCDVKKSLQNRALVAHARIRKVIDTAGGQTALSKAIGISRASVNAWYNDVNSLPSADNLIEIASKCGVSVDWLLGLTAEDNTSPNALVKQMSTYTGLDTRTVEEMHSLVESPRQQVLPGSELDSPEAAAIRFIKNDFANARENGSRELLCSMMQRYVEGLHLSETDSEALDVIKGLNSYKLIDSEESLLDISFPYELLEVITDSPQTIYRQELWAKIVKEIERLKDENDTNRMKQRYSKPSGK